MSDTFDHELEAFERWEAGECDAPGSGFFEDEKNEEDNEDEDLCI